MQQAVTLSQVSFSYQTESVLRGIEIKIPRGSYFGVVGPNGSGKTTLAFLISGIITPDEGIVDTHGNRIGLVLANPENQVVSLVVEEDIAFGPENLKLPPAEINARIGGVLKIVRAEHLRRSLTSAISGGELAKVVFAGQLAMDADVFVLDEGTVMLDPESRSSLLKTIQELNKDFGKTIIHISHRLDDLEPSDTVVVLHEGRIAARADGVLDLVGQMERNPIPGIEPGASILFQNFLRGMGIEVKDPEKASRILASKLCPG